MTCCNFKASTEHEIACACFLEDLRNILYSVVYCSLLVNLLYGSEVLLLITVRDRRGEDAVVSLRTPSYHGSTQ